jgi:predicted Abi (CAAX) family protease
MLRILGTRLVRAYGTIPTPRQWAEVVLLLALFLAAALPVGLASGLLTYAPAQEGAGALLVFAAVALAVPSLFEETLFRAALLPHPRERRPAVWVALSVVAGVTLFVLGHPLVAWLLAPATRPLAYHPVFLGLCTVFGVFASLAYLRTGSIWPSALMHWAVVVGWKIWFGGWIFAFGPPGP